MVKDFGAISPRFKWRAYRYVDVTVQQILGMPSDRKNLQKSLKHNGMTCC